MKSKKAQSGIEGMIIIGVIFFIFLIFFVIYQGKSRDVQVSQRDLAQRADCLQLSNTISNIFVAGPSSKAQITMYTNTTVYPGDQRIETPNNFCTISINRVSNTQTFTGTTFKLNSGKVTVEHNNINLVVVTNG